MDRKQLEALLRVLIDAQDIITDRNVRLGFQMYGDEGGRARLWAELRAAQARRARAKSKILAGFDELMEADDAGARLADCG